MDRKHLAVSTLVAAVVGGSVLLAMLPWGDPCSFPTSLAAGTCAIAQEQAPHYVRNAAFMIICVLIGFLAGSIARSHKTMVGVMGTVVAVIGASIIAPRLYGLEASSITRWNVPALAMAALFCGGAAALGLVGGLLAKYSPLGGRKVAP